MDEIEGNARPAPAVLNRLVAALPVAPPAPANSDEAVDGDEGAVSDQQRFLMQSQAVLQGQMRSYQRRTRRRLTVANTMLILHGLYVSKLFAKNLMEVASISGFGLIVTSMPSAVSTAHTVWACNNSVIWLVCTNLVVQGWHVSSTAPELEP